MTLSADLDAFACEVGMTIDDQARFVASTPDRIGEIWQGQLEEFAERALALERTSAEPTVPLAHHAELVSLVIDWSNAWTLFTQSSVSPPMDLPEMAAVEEACEKVYRWIAKNPVRTNDRSSGTGEAGEGEER